MKFFSSGDKFNLSEYSLFTRKSPGFEAHVLNGKLEYIQVETHSHLALFTYLIIFFENRNQPLI